MRERRNPTRISRTMMRQIPNPIKERRSPAFTITAASIAIGNFTIGRRLSPSR